VVIYKHVPAICSKSSLRCGFSAAIGFRWAVSSEFSIGRAPGNFGSLVGFSSRSVILSVAEGSFCHPGFRTLSDPGTVQDDVKQSKGIIVLVCRKIFPVENHSLTLRWTTFNKYPLVFYGFFLLLHPASEEGICWKDGLERWRATLF